MAVGDTRDTSQTISMFPSTLHNRRLIVGDLQKADSSSSSLLRPGRGRLIAQLLPSRQNERVSCHKSFCNACAQMTTKTARVNVRCFAPRNRAAPARYDTRALAPSMQKRRVSHHGVGPHAKRTKSQPVVNIAAIRVLPDRTQFQFGPPAYGLASQLRRKLSPFEYEMNKFVRRLIVAVAWNAVCFGGFMFLGAGTFHWWRAWVLLCVAVVATVAMMVGVFRDRPDLLRERMKGIIQKGQPMSDRLIVLPFVISFGVLFWLIPNDVFRLHLLPLPGLVVSSLGLLMFAAGWWIIALSFKANTFAIPVVRHQQERQHVVVDSGVYAIVRHPMYVGVILFMIGMPLWLESYAAALFAIVPSAALVVRILIEERFLQRELAGYEAYTKRVRYRLVPFVW